MSALRATAGRLLLAAGVAAACVGAVRAEEPARGTLNLVFENDRIANTDRHYTHGSYGSYVTADGDVPGWAARAGRRLPLLGDGVDRVGYVLGQTIFTPDDIGARRVIRDDRPYAGYLYGGVRLISEQIRADLPDGLQSWELNLGVVGSPSQADDVQDLVHDLIGVQRPNGWDNQLATEPALNLYYERKWRFLGPLDRAGHQVAFVPHAGAALGNVYTYAAAGASVAVGRNLRAGWGPARIRPAVRGSGFFDAVRPDGGGNWFWNVFAGAQARLVARNLFLDGSTFQDSHSVDRRPLVAELQFGAELGWRRYRLAITQVFRTREFDQQDESDAFGAVTLSVKF